MVLFGRGRAIRMIRIICKKDCGTGWSSSEETGPSRWSGFFAKKDRCTGWSSLEETGPYGWSGLFATKKLLYCMVLLAIALYLHPKRLFICITYAWLCMAIGHACYFWCHSCPEVVVLILFFVLLFFFDTVKSDGKVAPTGNTKFVVCAWSFLWIKPQQHLLSCT